MPLQKLRKAGVSYRFLVRFLYGFFAIFETGQIPYVFNRKSHWYKPVFKEFVMLKWGGVFRYPPHSPRLRCLILGRVCFLSSAVVKAETIIGQMIVSAFCLCSGSHIISPKI